MKIYMSYHSDTFKFNGFYLEDIHDEIPIPNICIDEELWNSLRELTTDFELIKDFQQKEIYTIEDMSMFVTIPFKSDTYKPTRIDIIEQENADLLLDSALKDERIEQLENDLSDLMLEIATMGGN